MVDLEGAPAFRALEGLLGVFRQGRILDAPLERQAFDDHLAGLSERWDRRFPGFPREYFPYTSFRGEWYRGRRDAHLQDVIVGVLGAESSGTIVNPACVFGTHGRRLARRLPRFRVLATDLERRWDLWYRRFNRNRTPANYECRKDDVFEPRVRADPTAVVFFGACGAVSDGAIDYAVDAGARYLICRTCCHDNIGGNTSVVPRRSFVNRFFRFKNRALDWMRGRAEFEGLYFSDRYPPSAYPRSEVAGRLTTSDELLDVAAHSPESDVCRAIIDLDRHLHLEERGYEVWYQGELFFAERPGR